MGKRRNKPGPPVDLNLPSVGAELPPLEFKGKRRPPRKGRKRANDTDAQGRQRA